MKTTLPFFLAASLVAVAPFARAENAGALNSPTSAASPNAKPKTQATEIDKRATEIEQLFNQDKSVAEGKNLVRVTAENGKIILTGNVDSVETKQRFELLAQQDAGKFPVENRLMASADAATRINSSSADDVRPKTAPNRNGGKEK